MPQHLERLQIASSVFLVAVSLAAAAGFLTYGGRLFLMLHRFPIESPGRLKKLREVCTTAWSHSIYHYFHQTRFSAEWTGHWSVLQSFLSSHALPCNSNAL